VEHGKTGFLVNDIREMAEAIVAASGLDAEICRAEARRRFSLKQMISSYMDAYHALAGLGAGRRRLSTVQ
ncbi:MAG: glycosyltransferase family 4 protein, partial [Mesorhizobium sp.]